MTLVRKLLSILLPVLVLAASVMGARTLIARRPQAERKPAKALGTVVETQRVDAAAHRVTVYAQGTVVPAQEVALQPEVTGRVTWLNPRLVVGGRLRKGEILIRIDPRDYALAVEQQKGQVDRARLEVELEHGRKAVAEREWKLFSDGAKEPASDATLALREPQLRTAKVALESAESALEQARIRLDRATVRAPFNAIVRSESVEMGQLVGPTMSIASLVGSDAFWVQLSLPLADLQWLEIPGVNTRQGSRARVAQEVGKQRVIREGRIVRLLGDLDPVGRMARVLVDIPDPLRLEHAREGEPAGLPLLLGAYVNVELEGRALASAIEVPRAALRDGDQVYVVSPETTLEIRKVEVAYRGPETVLVTAGLAPGERIVTSHVPAAVEGMQLKLVDADAAQGAATPPPEHAARDDADAREPGDVTHGNGHPDTHATSETLDPPGQGSGGRR